MVDLGILVLRLSFSILMFFGHGIPKLLDPQSHVNFVEILLRTGFLSAPLAYLSISAETLFQMLIAVGLFTRISALVSAINMLVAFLSLAFIREEPFPVYEKATLYFIVYVSLLFTGAGRFSLDAYLKIGR